MSLEDIHLRLVSSPFSLAYLPALALLAAGWGLFATGRAELPVAAGMSLAAIVLIAFVWRAQERSDGPSGKIIALDDQRIAAVRAHFGVDHRRSSSIRDESTGLYTRWYFERRVIEEAARCRRYDHPMAVLVLRTGVVGLTDMSNDDWQQRREIAARYCTQVIRNVDLSSSLGPFEFAILLVHCDGMGATRVVERLEKELSDYGCEVGVSVYPNDSCEPEEMIGLAQARLQMAA